MNRSPPGSNQDQKFIKNNVHNIKHLSNLQKLKKLAGNDMTTRGLQNGLPKNLFKDKDKTSFIFFKRSKNNSNRRFNETSEGSLSKCPFGLSHFR